MKFGVLQRTLSYSYSSWNSVVKRKGWSGITRVFCCLQLWSHVMERHVL